MPKIGAVIQARMKSTRLYGKVLNPLGGKTSIKHIIRRLNRCKNLDQIIVATTHSKSDEPIICESARVISELDLYDRIKFFRGSELDVLKRIYDCARLHDLDVIVDITADCPLVDPKHVDHLIKQLITDLENLDCATNCLTRSWPNGFDIIVYKFIALRGIHRLVSDPNHRQHGGWNLFNHTNKFNILNWEAEGIMNQPNLGLTLDTAEDYVVLDNIFKRFKKIGRGNDFNAEEVIYYLNEFPGVITNKNVVRKKEGEG